MNVGSFYPKFLRKEERIPGGLGKKQSLHLKVESIPILLKIGTKYSVIECNLYFWVVAVKEGSFILNWDSQPILEVKIRWKKKS